MAEKIQRGNKGPTPVAADLPKATLPLAVGRL